VDWKDLFRIRSNVVTQWPLKPASLFSSYIYLYRFCKPFPWDLIFQWPVKDKNNRYDKIWQQHTKIPIHIFEIPIEWSLRIVRSPYIPLMFQSAVNISSIRLIWSQKDQFWWKFAASVVNQFLGLDLAKCNGRVLDRASNFPCDVIILRNQKIYLFFFVRNSGFFSFVTVIMIQ